jgi:hypothetical protein
MFGWMLVESEEEHGCPDRRGNPGIEGWGDRAEGVGKS